ncbi:uncharacterized protein YecT (DUF1311 family) [Erwinia toletana]|uniref:Uncharacterized protein YecT (DUF1311 family) n=1 Tax=Winslowiella toletana TaxID=92490 RepID=A0ABS4P720_9GAMM|nr:lysozyme inhibitor LprI family protein [Winslowiella toletana]MBP2167743.1 uncharacterized protein YecT (DUF1311 family) [Winslowiella toletana]
MSKRLLALLFLNIFPLASKGELSWGEERDSCFKKEQSIALAYNCLAEDRQQSTNKVDALIAETNKRIKANNIGPFNGKEDAKETSGDVYSKRFLEAQKEWKKYRDKLCLAIASELDEDAYDYQSYIDQCTINLNKRHIDEINLMGLPPAS